MGISHRSAKWTRANRLALLAGFVLASGSWGGTAPLAPCEDVEAPDWVRSTWADLLRSDGLLRYGLDRFGPPLLCEGNVTDEFDGAPYGHVRVTFPEEAFFELETQPPAVRIATLRVPAGFHTPAEARRILAGYAASRGLDIQGIVPRQTTLGDERVEQFEGPDPGLNASAWLIYEGDRIVGLRLSMAP